MNTLHPAMAAALRPFTPYLAPRRVQPQPVEEICCICSGSGEGQHEGTACWSCGGSGVERVEE